MKMKKYLFMALAVAVSGVFVGCHEDELGGSLIEQKRTTFEETFIKAFGQADPTHNWGFRFRDDSLTRSVSANGNQWADPNYNDLQVPPPLTDKQIAVVKKYFQTTPDLGYEDPHWTDYFMQQVYKGHTSVPEGCATKEEYLAADQQNKIIASDHMDHLAAIDEERGILDHINNFNHGDCGAYGNVLDNGGNTNSGPFHSDKINLMTNSTTKSFGYYNSDGSVRHTEYTGLVSFQTIINALGDEASCLDDGWNRSFMGFDFEQMVGEDVYAKSGNGWAYYTFNNRRYHYLNSNLNMYCGDLKEYNNVPSQAEIEDLLSKDYLPVAGSADKKWVKVGGCADRYFSDWIVCLTEAKSNGNRPKAPDVWKISSAPGKRYYVIGQRVVESGRVMCEDLAGATGKFDDMDYNDIVFDAAIINEYKKLVTAEGVEIVDPTYTDVYDRNYAMVRLMAAGGTIPVTMTIGLHNFDVHSVLGASDNTMINTLPETEDNTYLNGATVVEKAPVTLDGDEDQKFYGIDYISDIRLDVLYDHVSTELKTKAGDPAPLKFLIPLGLPWAKERRSFGEAYPDFGTWVNKKENEGWYNAKKPELLYNLEGLEVPEDYESDPIYLDDNGSASAPTKKKVAANPGTMAYPTSAETILYDFNTQGAGYLCPEIGDQSEEFVSITTGTSAVSEGQIIRIYGVSIDDWYIISNISEKIEAYESTGSYIDIPVTSSNLVEAQRAINIAGKHFTVTYVTVRSGGGNYQGTSVYGEFNFENNNNVDPSYDFSDAGENSVLRIYGHYYKPNPYQNGETTWKLNVQTAHSADLPFKNNSDPHNINNSVVAIGETEGCIELIFTSETGGIIATKGGLQIRGTNFKMTKLTIEKK